MVKTPDSGPDKNGNTKAQFMKTIIIIKYAAY